MAEQTNMSGQPKRKTAFLPAYQLTLLNNACIPIVEAFGHHPYLVGSARQRPDWRDVDVRSILPDDEFDALFTQREFFWSLICLAVSEYLSRISGLPVDYQIQRQTQANEKHPGERSALGFRAREYAGGGDAKPNMGSDWVEA
jgi:hypothetical protein